MRQAVNRVGLRAPVTTVLKCFSASLAATPELRSLRDWAVTTFVDKTRVSDSVASELRGGAVLPAVAVLEMPVAGTLRIAIVRPEGAADDKSRQIAGALVAANYSNGVISTFT